MMSSIKNIFERKKILTLPIQIEIGDPKLEEKISDVILISGRIEEFNSFYKRGGPFRRESSRIKWAKFFNINKYEWPDFNRVLKEFEAKIQNEIIKIKPHDEKFKVLKFLGPTELAESFCAQGVPDKYYLKGEIYHDFNFSYLSIINPNQAQDLHRKITEYILYIINKSKMINFFQSIRIADDIFNYQGYLYPKDFVFDSWRKNHSLIVKAVKKRNCFAILHSDGNLGEEISFIDSIYDGLHPLDLIYKNSFSELKKWLVIIEKIRERTKLVFFTGIPINFLYGEDEKFKILEKFIFMIIKKLKDKRFILSTTHRPYASIDINSNKIINRFKIIRDIVNGLT